MRKTQLGFENFLVGFLFVFFLASSVFLFIGQDVAGVNIDFFNRTIFSTQQSGLDMVYLSLFENGDVNEIDEEKYNIDETQVEFSVTRTSLPPTSNNVSHPGLEMNMFVVWEKCTATSCTHHTITDEGIRAEALHTYTFAQNINEDIYSGCSSDILIGTEIIDSDFTETIIDNNNYTITLPYCFAPPPDVRINSISIDNNAVQINITNLNYLTEFKLNIELTDEEGNFKEVSFENIYDSLSMEDGAPFNNYMELEPNNYSFYLDLNEALNNEPTIVPLTKYNIVECSGGKIRAEIEYREAPTINEIFFNSTEDVVYEYDNNGNPILINNDILIFQEPGFDLNVYDFQGDRVELFTNVYDENGNIMDQHHIEVTHDISDSENIRDFDIKKIMWFEDGILKGYNGVSCEPVVDEDITCYCDIICGDIGIEKPVIQNYYAETIINDADYSNNIMEQIIDRCVI